MPPSSRDDYHGFSRSGPGNGNTFRAGNGRSAPRLDDRGVEPASAFTGLGSISTYLTTRFGIEEGKSRRGTDGSTGRSARFSSTASRTLICVRLAERLFGAWERTSRPPRELARRSLSTSSPAKRRSGYALELTPQGATAPVPDEPDLYRASRNEILWASATENHALQIFLMAALNVPVLTVIALNLPIGRHLVRESGSVVGRRRARSVPYLSVASLASPARSCRRAGCGASPAST